MQDVIKNIKFWKTIRPYCSNEGHNQTEITVAEKDYYNR